MVGLGSSGLSQVGKELFLDGSGTSRKEEATLCSVTAEGDLKVQSRPLCVLVTPQCHQRKCYPHCVWKHSLPQVGCKVMVAETYPQRFGCISRSSCPGPTAVCHRLHWEPGGL